MSDPSQGGDPAAEAAEAQAEAEAQAQAEAAAQAQAEAAAQAQEEADRLAAAEAEAAAAAQAEGEAAAAQAQAEADAAAQADAGGEQQPEAAGDPSSPGDNPPTAEGDNVETYEGYVGRMLDEGSTPMSRSDWTRESGSAGGAGPNGPVGPAGPEHAEATSVDSAEVDNHERTSFSHTGPERVSLEGTQIDPKDGVRKPIDQIEKADAPEYDLVDAYGQGAVFVDRRNTQIGPDGKRHELLPDGTLQPSEPSARHD